METEAVFDVGFHAHLGEFDAVGADIGGVHEVPDHAHGGVRLPAVFAVSDKAEAWVELDGVSGGGGDAGSGGVGVVEGIDEGVA